jgi:glycosyltransferase involved in cell wall biosynthesis
MADEFPDADLYTFAYGEERTFEYFKAKNVRVPPVGRLIRSHQAFRFAYPIAAMSMHTLDLRGYDAVLSSSASVAKYVQPICPHICYCYTPTRAIWMNDLYFGHTALGMLVRPLLAAMKRYDYRAAQRVTRFLAISEHCKRLISKFYGREATVLPAPIDNVRFRPTAKREEHFLLVSRLEAWKHVDIAIEAFNTLGLPLRVVGTGAEEYTLKSLAKANIQFVGKVSDDELVAEYSRARAVVFTSLMEYSLVPLEANACGTPTICLGLGGLEEIIVPWNATQCNIKATAVSYCEQTPMALCAAVREFERASFDNNHLIQHAANYSIPIFRSSLRRHILETLDAALVVSASPE